MARKRLKKKLRSYALCKPHKMRGCCRWKPNELAGLKEFEKIRKDLALPT